MESAVSRRAELVQEFHAALGKDGRQGTLLQPLEAGNEGLCLKIEVTISLFCIFLGKLVTFVHIICFLFWSIASNYLSQLVFCDVIEEPPFDILDGVLPLGSQGRTDEL